MKKDVLSLLRQKPDTFISGNQISRALGVTRSSIWKNIKALQQDGYTIEAITNKGYRLVASPDFLEVAEVQKLLTTSRVGRSINLYEIVESTNRQALQAAERGIHDGTVFAAQEQEMGRGRLGRTWYSPRHTCLMMSILLRPDVAINNIAQITLVTGLAVCQALQGILQESLLPPCQECRDSPLSPLVGIKWPNDILINGKKAVGILTELTAEIEQIKALTVGIGVNVLVPAFPLELADSATSLLLETGKSYSLNGLAAAILNRFEPLYEKFLENKFDSDILPLYLENCVTLGQDIKAIRNNQEIRGRAAAINKAGELIMQLDTGETVSLNSGEVSVRGLMGYGQ